MKTKETIVSKAATGVAGVQFSVIMLYYSCDGTLTWDNCRVSSLTDTSLHYAQEWLSYGPIFKIAKGPLQRFVKNFGSAPLRKTVVMRAEDGLRLAHNWEANLDRETFPEGIREGLVDNQGHGYAVVTVVPTASNQEPSADQAGVETILSDTNFLHPTYGLNGNEDWSSSYKILVDGRKENLRKLSIDAAAGDLVIRGLKVVSVKPAYEISEEFFAPIVYAGNDDDAPHALLRFDNDFEYIFPVYGAKGNLVCTRKHNPKWEIKQAYTYLCRKDQYSRNLVALRAWLLRGESWRDAWRSRPYYEGGDVPPGTCRFRERHAISSSKGHE
jgi:hypothetical protein